MKKIASGSKVTNQQVKVLVTNYFGERIKFSWPKQLNKSALVFSASVTGEAMAETIRGKDPIRQCATLIRQSLMEVDFDLQDRFCDVNDLRLAWENTTIPEPLLKFMSVLFKFDMDAFKTKQQNMAQMLKE